MDVFYSDAKLILDTDYLVEAHTLDGQEEYDGMYLIMCTLSIGEVVKEIGAVYNSVEDRDSAFLALAKSTELKRQFNEYISKTTKA